MSGFEEASFRLSLWVNMTALLLTAGAAIFLLVVWRRSATTARPPLVETRFIRTWRRTIVTSWIAAALSSVVLLVRGDQPEVETVRLGLVLFVGVAWLGLRSRPPFVFQPDGSPPGSPEPPPFRRLSRGSMLVVLLALPGLLVSLALTGHAGRTALSLPNLLVALVHVTGAAAWAGGLVMLIAVAFPAVRREQADETAALLAPVVERFSDLALWSVVVVVASGSFTAWNGIRELHAVTGSAYGLMFVAKLSVFLPALAMGAVNNRWTKPQLMKAARGLAPAGSPVRLIRRLVLVEVVLVAVVLALTAFLVRLPLPSRLFG
jgi:uncharacterized membrane protein